MLPHHRNKPDDHLSLIQSWDWEEAFSYASFNIEDVAQVIAAEEGENDGENWLGVFKLKNGRYGALRAGCDYTGWDCQAWGDSDEADTLEELIRFGLTIAERSRLGFALEDD